MKTILCLLATALATALLLPSCAVVEHTRPDGSRTTMASLASKTYARQSDAMGGELELMTNGEEVPKALISGWKWMEGMRALRSLATDAREVIGARDAAKTERLRIDRAAQTDAAEIAADLERAQIESAAEIAAPAAP